MKHTKHFDHLRGSLATLLAAFLLAACGGSDDPAVVPDTGGIPDTTAAVKISAAVGGAANSPDGRARLTFPADAFTADVSVVFTPIQAATLPATEEFASFETTPGSFYRVDFSGGQLKPDVAIKVELKRPGLVQAVVQTLALGQVQRAMLPATAPSTPDNTNRVAVVECAGETFITWPTDEPSGYEVAQGISCSGSPSGSMNVGQGTLAPAASTTLYARPIGTAYDDYLYKAIATANGRTAFGYETTVPTATGTTSASGVGIVASNGGVTRGPLATSDSATGISLIGFDGGGTLLGVTSDCRLAAYGQRVSSLLGASIASAPTWTVQLPLFGSTQVCGIPKAAPTATGWVVVYGTDITWYSNQGAELQKTSLQVLNPTSYPNAGIGINDVLADAQGNVWLAGNMSTAVSSCAVTEYAGMGGIAGCPFIAKLSATGAVLAHHVFGAVFAHGQYSPIVLAGDASGAVYAAMSLAEINNFRAQASYGRISVTRFAPDGLLDWSGYLPETWGVEATAMAVDTTGRVYVGTDKGSIGGSVTMPTELFGRFVYRLTASGAGDGYVKVVEFVPSTTYSIGPMGGLSVDVNGALTYMGDFYSLDGVNAQTCPGPDGGTCSDLFVKKFIF